MGRDQIARGRMAAGRIATGVLAVWLPVGLTRLAVAQAEDKPKQQTAASTAPGPVRARWEITIGDPPFRAPPHRAREGRKPDLVQLTSRAVPVP